jgi:predicted aldo/keto reductase-like oxidoreductase
MKKSNPWTRRDFIAKPAAFVAASQLLRHSNFLFAEAAAPAPAAAKKLITRTVGKTGIKVPLIGMGISPDDGVTRLCYESGVRFFLSASDSHMQNNEIELGNLFKEMGIRKDILIATNLLPEAERKPLNSAQAGEMLKTEFETSLKNFHTDYMDFLLVHAVQNPADLSIEGILEVLTKLKKEGKVRAIGVTTHSPAPVLNEVARLGVHDLVIFPFNGTMASNQQLLTAIDNAYKRGIGLMAMKSTVPGVFKKPDTAGDSQEATQFQPPPHPEFTPEQIRLIQEGKLTIKLNTPTLGTGAAHTALLKWVLQHESIASIVSSFGNYDHVKENLSVAYDIAYTDEERKVLADQKLISSLEFCQQCRQCLASCPNGAEIPTLMRTHMYALQYYPGTGFPHEALAEIAPGRGLEACANCNSCTASCANTVNIPRKIMQLKAWYESVQA